VPIGAPEGLDPAAPSVVDEVRRPGLRLPRELWIPFGLAMVTLVTLPLNWTAIPVQVVLAIGWAASLSNAVVAAVVSFTLARSPTLHEAVRRFWRHLTVAASLVVVGSVIHAVETLRWEASEGVIQPSAAEMVFFLVSVLVLLRGLLLLPGAHRTRAEWQTFGLDAGIVLVGGALVAWIVIAGAVRAGAALADLVMLVVAVSATTVCGGLVALKLVAGGIRRVDPGALKVLAVGMLASGCLGGLAQVSTADRLPDAYYVMIAWGMFVFVLAAGRQRRNAAASHRLESARAMVGGRPRAARHFVRLPYLAVGITDVLLLASTWQYRAAAVIAAGAVVLTALVLVRQLVISREMGHVVGRLDGTVVALRDSQERLTFQASHDALTGLPNRTLLRGQIDESLRAATSPGSVAIALIDLDDFKVVNDRLGHDIGDELLVLTTARLSEALAGGDLVGRLGGDEFALVLRGIRADTMHERIGPVLEALAEPLVVSGNEIFVSASIGVACATENISAEELLRQADVAMYVAKKRDGSSWATYSAQMDSDAIAYTRTATGLRQGLANDEFLLCYQPIVTLPEGRIVGTEALLRWQDPETGRMVPPDQFIPIAERSGFIVPLGAWVLNQACRQAVAWRRELGDGAPDYVSVNISPRQLVEDTVVAEVAAALAESGLPSGCLLLEVTETAVFGGGPALTALDGLRELGVRIALDDFGTGHSSLGLLLSCPVDVLKLDKSFVDDVTGPGRQAVIATFLAGVARGLNLQTVAEGVETAEQAQRLYELGYENAQGYYFARPLPSTELTALLTTRGTELMLTGP
jgi:diguanylate cyclase (GGDEF)-like protein